MCKSSPEKTSGAKQWSLSAMKSSEGVSPYSTGSGGVTFERKVAVKYLTHLLVGDGARELGDGRCVLSVAFQQAPDHPVDDLIVSAGRAEDEQQPSLVLALGVRRSPKLIVSDVSTRKLIRQFVNAVINAPTDGLDHRLGLVVAGPQQHAEQLAKLVDHAAVQMDAPGFFALIRTPKKFDAGIRGRLDQLSKLVECALSDLGFVDADMNLVQERTWQLLSKLTVLMPRLESPDETDWSTVENSLIQVARGSDLAGGSRLRNQLLMLAGEYSPRAARVDLTLLRRDAHALLDLMVRRNRQGCRMLDHLQSRALASVSDVITGSDGARQVRLARDDAAAELLAITDDANAVVVTGESGVGKSALTLLSITAAAAIEPDTLQALCINLRQVPEHTVEFENVLGCPLSTLLCELSAPRRMLIIDGADAIAEGRRDMLRYLVHAAQESDVKVIAITAFGTKQVVWDTLSEDFAGAVPEHVVPLLSDPEIDEIVKTFPELGRFSANKRSHTLLRRLVVIDLLIRGHVTGIPLTDADAMTEIWSGLVRRRELHERGSPDARELVLLQLADLELKGSNRLDVISGFDDAALDGLRRDGLLRISPDDPFTIGPEFAHDEVRRYAVARLLLAGETPASNILQVGAPRWALSAAQLACQVWLRRPETSRASLRGRFTTLQASFDAIVEAGHGTRWGDVPGEALLALTNPEAILRDAWLELRANNSAGLQRLARLLDQRFRDDNGIIDISAVEPVISLMLEDHVPWRSGEHAEGLFRAWLRGLVVANTAAGHKLRIMLHERLVEECKAADRRFVEKQKAAAAARAARTKEEIDKERQSDEKHSRIFTEIGYGGHRQRRQQRPEVPYEIKNEIVLELFALLGPDLRHDGEAILLRVAQDAPSWLAPAVEEPLTGRALANYRRGLLARLSEAYYLDEEAEGSDIFDYGIRHHRARGFGISPLASWYRGPFLPLFQTDFHNGVALLNRLLNHAALIRARSLAGIEKMERNFEGDTVGSYQTELEITGARQLYTGDDQVWLWYRGTGVGPYPCISALQALERVCDGLIKNGTPIRSIVSILLGSCESLAMVSFIVGLLIRHLEDADNLLDPYLTEPHIWRLEFSRVVSEMSGLAADSEGLAAPERRKWSLREAAGLMALRADDARIEELRALGEMLVTKERHRIESTLDNELTKTEADSDGFIEQQLAPARAWASVLNRDGYQAHDTPDGLYIQATPPEDVVQALQDINEAIESERDVTRLTVRYYVKPKKERAHTIGRDELAADLTTSRKLLDNPPFISGQNTWDTPALVAAAALEAHILDGVDLPDKALLFATETVIRIAEGESWPRPYEMEETFYEEGADRSAARTLPLLLLPVAGPLRAIIDEADGWTTFERVARAGVNLAQAVASEVRLHLARGLDNVWQTPCTETGQCHHQVGWLIANETMRNCVLGDWEPDTGRRNVLALKEPFTEALTNIDDGSVLASRIDAAIRALAPAATANICVSTQAHTLLLTLLNAQRQSLRSQVHDRKDDRGSHTLVGARALLTLAEHDDAAVYEHINAYADNSALLDKLLRAFSAAAEETPGRAATARRIWPKIVRHVLGLNDSGHKPFQDAHYGDMALAALLPNAASETTYLYREVQQNPIVWWEPLALRSEVETWLPIAAGRAICADQLISFLSVLTPVDQVSLGLSWVANLVLADPDRVARRAYSPSNWLIEIRAAAVDAGLLANWQEVVDALVVAGVSRLASYSE